MKTALVTGSSGLIGQYMVNILEDRGYSVYTCDIKQNENMLQVLPRVNRRFDLVVHCASLKGSRLDSQGDPMRMATNLVLDATFFSWAVETKQKRVLYFSSAAVYRTELGIYAARIREKSVSQERIFIHNPDGNYGWAKLTGERLAEAALMSGIPVQIVRPFTVYCHKLQNRSRPFHQIINQARNRKTPFELWGDGSHVRDWIHAYDVAHGAISVVDNDIEEPINLCTGVGTSTHELALMACEAIGFEPSFKTIDGVLTGPQFQVGDPSLLHHLYEPRIKIEDSVAEAMKWSGPGSQS